MTQEIQENIIIQAKSKFNYGRFDRLYTVSQKNIPDIFDYNLKKNYSILIIFSVHIFDTMCHQNDHLASHLKEKK